MKIVHKEILQFQEKDFFYPLRDKIDYVKLITLSSRILLLEYDNNGIVPKSSMKLIIDKMSRLFFYKDNKFFSVSFPFNVQLEGNKVTEITTYSGKKLDSQNISYIISILDNQQFRLNPSPIDFYSETNDFDEKSFSLLEEILLSEPGYIRYDNDIINENGKLHPQHHLDINYTSYGTFKLGLNDIIADEYFENILNINIDCSYVVD